MKTMLKKHKKHLCWLAAFIGLGLLAAGIAEASTGTEFQQSGDKLEGWIGGQYGRAAALASTGIGLLYSIGTKQFMPILYGLGGAIALPLVIGVIDSSFSAVMIV